MNKGVEAMKIDPPNKQALRKDEMKKSASKLLIVSERGVLYFLLDDSLCSTI